MQAIILSPNPSQSSVFSYALQRQNIEIKMFKPGLFSESLFSTTDALIFPHPLSFLEWKALLRPLKQAPKNFPLLLIGKGNPILFSRPEFKTLLDRCVQIDDSFTLDQIAQLIRESLQKKKGDGIKDTIKVNELALDRKKRSINVKGKNILLTKKEYFLMELFMMHPGQVITRESIVDHVWDRRSFVAQNTIDVYISRLRKKIDKRVKQTCITTIPCLGYQFQKKETLQTHRM